MKANPIEKTLKLLENQIAQNDKERKALETVLKYIKKNNLQELTVETIEQRLKHLHKANRNLKSAVSGIRSIK